MSFESRADGFAGDSDVGQEREALGMVLHPPRVRPVHEAEYALDSGTCP